MQAKLSPGTQHLIGECDWCQKAIAATLKVSKAGKVEDQYDWYHEATGSEECDA